MNKGIKRGIGMSELFPNTSGTNPLTEAVGAQATIGNQATDGNTVRRSDSREGRFVWSQDYIYIGSSVSKFLLPKGTWDVLLMGGGGAGGGATTPANTGVSGGGGSAALPVRMRVVTDGLTPYNIAIGGGGTGVSASNGGSGSSTSVSGLNLSSGIIPAAAGQLTSPGGSGGFGCASTTTVGWGAIPGYPTVNGQGITTAPYAYIFPGSGGGLATTAVSGIAGFAGKPNAYGCTGGGAGATTNSSLGGNGGAAGGIMTGGTPGSGNTGVVTPGVGGNAAANTGSGGGGSGGGFTGASDVAGGNGGTGWVEFFRRA